MSTTANIESEVLVDDDSGEEWLRIAINTAQIRPGTLPAIGTAYKDATLPAAKTRIDLYGTYILRKYVNGPPGIRFAHFLKPKTEDQANTPYKSIPDSKHYDWPTVLHAVAFAEDPEYPVTETRPGPRTVSVPRLRARPITTEGTFALCKTVTDYYLSDTPFDIPPHPQPVAGAVTWVINNTETSLTCLHDDLDLPARGQNWNIVNIAGDASVISPPTDTRHFPATVFTTWEPFTIADAQEETEAGHFRRRRTRLFPPPVGELMTL
jgi:hypothetical protein